MHRRPEINRTNRTSHRQQRAHAPQVGDQLRGSPLPETSENARTGLEKWSDQEIRLVHGGIKEFTRKGVTPKVKEIFDSPAFKAALDVARNSYNRKRDATLKHIQQWALSFKNK